MRPQRVSPRIVLPNRARSSTRMALVACSALLAASAAHAGGSLQDATDLRQKRFGSQRSLEEHLAQFVAQDAAFVHAVATRGRPEVSGEDGYRALDLALRIHESLPSLDKPRNCVRSSFESR